MRSKALSRAAPSDLRRILSGARVDQCFGSDVVVSITLRGLTSYKLQACYNAMRIRKQFTEVGCVRLLGKVEVWGVMFDWVNEGYVLRPESLQRLVAPTRTVSD